MTLIDTWRRILDVWRPRTEFGRTLKHKLKYGLKSSAPSERLFRRRRW